MRPREKGGSRRWLHGTFPRRLDDEDPCSCRCRWPSNWHRPDPRTSARQQGRRANAEGYRKGCQFWQTGLMIQTPFEPWQKQNGRGPIFQQSETARRAFRSAHGSIGSETSSSDSSTSSKQFRGIATRYDKDPQNFLAAVKLLATRIWIRSL